MGEGERGAYSFKIIVQALCNSAIKWGWLGGAKVLCISSSGRPTDIGLQLGKACYPCSR